MLKNGMSLRAKTFQHLLNGFRLALAFGERDQIIAPFLQGLATFLDVAVAVVDGCYAVVGMIEDQADQFNA